MLKSVIIEDYFNKSTLKEIFIYIYIYIYILITVHREKSLLRKYLETTSFLETLSVSD